MEEGRVEDESVVISVPPAVLTVVVLGVTPVVAAIWTVNVVKDLAVELLDARPLLSL
jgi:hypothetical protein